MGSERILRERRHNVEKPAGNRSSSHRGLTNLLLGASGEENIEAVRVIWNNETHSIPLELAKYINDLHQELHSLRTRLPGPVGEGDRLSFEELQFIGLSGPRKPKRVRKNK